tara:strand:+ start:39843 stop:40811 length:969 start_codon:yes stop_codon:yes gene_type:complete
MFRHLKSLLVGIALLGGCGPSPAKAPLAAGASAVNEGAEASQVEPESALPARLAFIPKDASMVIRIDLRELLQSSLWTSTMAPQVDALADAVDGCESDIFDAFTDVVLAIRGNPGEEEADWEARFFTGGPVPGLVPCINAMAPMLNSFTVKETNAGFQFHDLSGAMLANVDTTDYGLRAGAGTLSGSKAPATEIYQRLADIKLDSPFWFASITDPELLDKPLEDGGGRGHQMWFELTRDDKTITIRGGTQYADASTAEDQQNDIGNAFLEGLQSKGVTIDLTEITDAAEARVEGRWVLLRGQWTHQQISEAIEKLQQGLGGA